MLTLSTLAVCLAAVLASSAPSCRAAALNPAFLWSSSPIFSLSADQEPSRISHQVQGSGFLFGVVDALAGKASGSLEFISTESLKKPDAIILLIGQSQKAGSVLEAKNAEEAAPLRQAMTSAASSLALPFVQHLGGDFVSSWEAHLQQASIPMTLVGNCGHSADASSTAALTREAATHGIQAALSKSSQVVLVCSNAEASLEQEMQLLEAAKEAAGSSSAVFGFVVQPSQGGAKAVGRSLLEASSASGSMLRLPTEEDLASFAASRDASAAAAKELDRARSSAQLAGLASDPRLTPAGFRPVPGGFKPSSLPVRPGNQGGDTPFQGLVCDDKCQVQVTMVEVAILGFTLISALISGTWLMHGVGTPTRFETSKESQHSQ
ncbi:hypothetical protein WJX74_001981 [Apatococcus lobatus]|uniref:Uncharacterized protein n=2 Tax=Apatococcus TaxID=904362 RepID=A0AAW1S4N3_9CHLO